MSFQPVEHSNATGIMSHPHEAVGMLRDRWCWPSMSAACLIELAPGRVRQTSLITEPLRWRDGVGYEEDAVELLEEG